MATEIDIQESVCLKKGEKSETALTSESFDEKVTELPGNNVKQLETSSLVTENVNTPLETGKPTDESGTFFQALSGPTIIADEHSNTPEIFKAAKQTEPGEKEEKDIESEVCKENAPEKAESEVESKVFDSVAPSKNEALGMFKNQGDNDGLTISQDATCEDIKETTTEDVTTVADSKELDLNETRGEIVKEESEEKLVDAKESIEKDTDVCVSTQTEVVKDSIKDEETSDDVTTAQDVAFEKDDEPEVVTAEERIEKDGEDIKSSEEPEKKTLMNSILSYVGFSSKSEPDSAPEVESTQKNDEETIVGQTNADTEETKFSDERKDSDEHQDVLHEKVIEKEVCEENGPEKAEFEGGLKTDDSIASSEKENFNVLEKHQGDSDVVISSQEAPRVDVEEATIVQDVTTLADFEEKDLNEKPREFIKEETEDKSVDAQKISLEVGQPNEQIVEETHPCLSETISENPGDEIKKEDKDLSGESVEDTNDDTTREEKFTLEKDPVDDEASEDKDKDDITSEQEVKAEGGLQEKNHQSEDNEHEVVESQESIEEATDVCVSTQEVVKDEEINDEKTIVKEVCEENGQKDAEFEGGLEIYDSVVPSQKETLNMLEKDQGDSDGVTSLQEAPRVDVEEATIGQHVTTVIDLKEQDVNEKPREFILEETKDKSLDAQQASKECEKGAKEDIEQEPEESVKKIEKEEETEESVTTDAYISTQTKSHVETTEHEEEERSDSSSVKEVCAETGSEKVEHEKEVKYSEIAIINKDENEDEEKEQEVNVLEKDESADVTSAQDVAFEKDDEPEVVTADKRIEKDGEDIKSSEEPEKKTLMNSILSYVGFSSKPEPEVESTEKNDEDAIERDVGQTITEETKSSDERKEDDEQQGLLHVDTTDVGSLTQTDYIEKTTEGKENNEEETIENGVGQAEKDESPLVEEVCEATSAEVFESKYLPHESVEDTNDDTIKEDKDVSHESVEQVPVEERSDPEDVSKETNIDSNETTEVEPQEDIKPCTPLETSAEDTLNSEKDKSESENLPIKEDLETVSEVKVPESVSRSEECFISETETHMDEEKELATKGFISDEKTEVQGGRDDVTNSEKESNDDIQETSVDQHDTTVASIEEGRSVSATSKEILIEEAVDKTIDSEEATVECEKGLKEVIEQDPKESVKNIEKEEETEKVFTPDVCISTQTESQVEKTEHEEEERSESPSVKEVCEETGSEKVVHEKEENDSAIAVIDKDENEDEEKEQEVNVLDTHERSVADVTSAQGVMLENDDEPEVVADEERIEKDGKDIKSSEEPEKKTLMNSILSYVGISSKPIPEEDITENNDEESSEIDAGQTNADEETKFSDERKENYEQQGLSHVINTDVDSLTQIAYTEKTKEVEENNDEESIENDVGQAEKHESPLVEACEATSSEVFQPEDTNDGTTKDVKDLSHESVEQEHVEKQSDQEDIVSSTLVETSTEATSNLEKERDESENLPIKDLETVSEVQIHEFVPKSEESLLKEECFSSETETNLNVEKDTVTKEISSDEKTEHATEIKQDTVKEVCEEKEVTTFKDDDQEKDHEASMSAESQGEDIKTNLQNEVLEEKEELQEKDYHIEGNKGDFIESGEGADEDAEEIKPRVETKEDTQHVITTDVCSSTQIQPDEETIENDERQLSDSSNVKTRELVVKDTEDTKSSDEAISSQNASIGVTEETMVDQHDTTAAYDEEWNNVSVMLKGFITKEEEADDKLTNAKEMSSELGQPDGHNVQETNSSLSKTITDKPEEEIKKEEKDLCLESVEDTTDNSTKEEKCTIEQAPVEEHSDQDKVSKEERAYLHETTEVEARDDITPSNPLESSIEDTSNSEMKHTESENLPIEDLETKSEKSELKEECFIPETETNVDEEKGAVTEEISSHEKSELTAEIKQETVKEACEETSTEKAESEKRINFANRSDTKDREEDLQEKNMSAEKDEEVTISKESQGEESIKSSQNEESEEKEDLQEPIEETIYNEENHDEPISSQNASNEDTNEKEIGQHATTMIDCEEALVVNATTKEIIEGETEDKSVHAQEVSKEIGQTKEQDVEEIGACLTETISEKAEDNITKKDVDTSQDGIEHINENIVTEKCIPDEISREIDIPKLEHEALEEQNNSLDEVPKENFSDLNETTAVEPYEDSSSAYVAEENRIETKEISSDENIETHESTQQPENSHSATEGNVTQLEKFGELNSLSEDRDVKEDVTQESQLNSTEDCSETVKDVILTKEIEQVPLEIEKENEINDLSEPIVKEDSYSAEVEEKSAQNEKKMVHEAYSDSIKDNEHISGVSKVTNEVDQEPEEERISSLEDSTTVESPVDLSNKESNAYPYKVRDEVDQVSRTLESDCDVHVPEVVVDSEDSKVKEECVILAAAEFTDENSLEEHDTQTNEISSIANTEQEHVTSAPTKSDEAKSGDLIREEKALTKEDLEIYGELNPTSEPMIGEDQVVTETKPQPEQSDVTSENITDDQTLESKLEHTSIKDLEDGKEDVTLAPENEKTKNIILTDEVAVETEKEDERKEIGQVSKDVTCPTELVNTSTENQYEIPNEIEYSVGNTEVTEVKAESQIEVKNILAAEDLSYPSKGSSIIDEKVKCDIINEEAKLNKSTSETDEVDADNEKETVEEPYADDSAKTTYDSVLSSPEKDIEARSEKSRDQGDTLKLEEKPTEVSEFATEVAELVPGCSEVSGTTDVKIKEQEEIVQCGLQEPEDNTLLSQNNKNTEDTKVEQSVEKDVIEGADRRFEEAVLTDIQKHEKDTDNETVKPPHLETKEATSEFIKQEYQKEQTKEADQNIEAVTPVEDVKTSTREFELRSVDLEVPSVMDATAGKADNKTVEVHEAGKGLLKDDEQLEPTCDQSKTTEKGSGMKQDEQAKGNTEVAKNLTVERDSALTKDQQVEEEDTGVKTDEEEEDDEKMGSGSDAPVMVDASRDVEEKVHKKSHNILSGVGSKVKHSIAKVKKAITGKSSPQKTPSPKAKDHQMTD